MIVFLFLLNFCYSYFQSVSNKKRVLVWMCLEMCGETKSDILDIVEIMKKKASTSLTDYSFEKYSLEEGSILKELNVTNVHSLLKDTIGRYGEKLKSLPMIVQGNIEILRQLFKDPDPFINELIKEGKKYDYFGYNIDIEPASHVTDEDRSNYIKLIEYMGKRLNDNGFQMNVDFCTNCCPRGGKCIFDIDNLKNVSSVFSFCDMDTYEWPSREPLFPGFKFYFDYAYDLFKNDLGKLGIGIDSEVNLPEEEVKKRFEYMKQFPDVIEVDIWRIVKKKFDEDSFWWEEFENFLN